MRTLTLIVALLAAVALGGCGGGGNRTGTSAPKAPQVVGLGTLDVDQDSLSAPVPFTLVDEDTAAIALVVTATASDPMLLPPDGIVIEGTGSARTLRVRAAEEATGTTTVIVTVRDPTGQTGQGTLTVRVNPVLVSFLAIANAALATEETGPAVRVQGVTVVPDADDDPMAFDAVLQ
jgi:hypothetical protein